MSSRHVSILEALHRHAPGLLLSAVIAAGGMALGALPLFARHGLSALTLAIVLGMALGNLLPGAWHARCAPGIGVAKYWLLRAGVVLYGFRLTLGDIGAVGIGGIALDVLVIASTFTLAWVLGVYWLKLDKNTALLIGAGSSICGAAAVMATEPVVRARADEVTVAVATVVVFGTLAIFIYPLLYRLNQQFGFLVGGERGFGIYIGATIHEVAQVVAVGRNISAVAADAAVISKMVRVMLLAPGLLALAWWLARDNQHHAGASTRHRVCVPWFAFGFVGVVVLNSLLSLPVTVSGSINTLDTGLLAMAMAALGVSTHVKAVAQAGVKPLLLASVLFVWLMAGGVGMYVLLNHWSG